MPLVAAKCGRFPGGHCAARAGRVIEVDVLDAPHARRAVTSDWVIVEGAGSCQVPLGRIWILPTGWRHAAWRVVRVVGMRLGCLNRALLSAHAIAVRARLIGWVANSLALEQPRLAANIRRLKKRLNAPLRMGVACDRNFWLRLDSQGS